ncbi:hypothetical protein [Flavobacterium sp.]|uniref:hypothetical protein n=1 Tax=Flavobacterium sp. TaxID=239 RepID=UPI00352860B0
MKLTLVNLIYQITFLKPNGVLPTVQTPPTPPPPTPPPGAPIDGGLFMLFFVAILFGVFVLYKYNTKKKQVI